MKKICIIFSLLFVMFAGTAYADILAKENQATYLVHFGRGVETKSVNHVDFHTFIAKQLTPLFPEGLTIYDAQGQRTAPKQGLVRENATVVEVVCNDDPALEEKLYQVAQTYVNTFKSAQVVVFITKIPTVGTALIY